MWQGHQQSAICKPHILRQYHFRHTRHPQYAISACHNLQLVELWLQFRFAFLIFLKNFLQFWPAVSLGSVRQRSWQRDSALTLINWRLWPCPNLMMRERGVDEGEWEQFQFVNTKKKNNKTNFYCIYWGRIVWATNWSIFCSSKRLPDRIVYRIYPAKQPSKLLVYFGLYSLYFFRRHFSMIFGWVKFLFYFFCFIQGWLIDCTMGSFEHDII